MLAVIEANNDWLARSPIPKLYIHVRPESVMKGHVLEQVRTFPNQTEVEVPGLHYVQEDSPHEIGSSTRHTGMLALTVDRNSGLMDLQHQFEVAAPVTDVWPAFLDMPRLAPCMPGAEITEVIDDRNVKGAGQGQSGPGQPPVRRAPVR